MDENLIRIKNALLAGKSGEMDDEMFTHTNRLKFAISILLDYPHKHRHEMVKLIQEEYANEEGPLSNAFCYKLLSDAQELFPSIERVNKAFELARLIKYGYKLLYYAEEKKNIRDGASVLKVLKELIQEAAGEEQTGTTYNIINILKSSPESLGIKQDENFVLEDFIKQLEKDYDTRNTIDITAKEV